MIDFSKTLLLLEKSDPKFLNYIDWQAISEESLPEKFIKKYFKKIK